MVVVVFESDSWSTVGRRKEREKGLGMFEKCDQEVRRESEKRSGGKMDGERGLRKENSR